jgi:hypothetical protein
MRTLKISGARRYFFQGILILCLALGGVYYALAWGGSGAESAAARFTPEQIIPFAEKVEKAMAAKGAQVAILARMGRPLAELPEGMHFTHVAFAVYSEIDTADGTKRTGYTIYNLYQRDNRPDISDLVQDVPSDFFSKVADLEAGIIIPSADLQSRLLRVIESSTYKELHDPNYSVIANPYTLGRQNCTEFVLDVIHAAFYETSDINLIKSNEKALFVAQPVNVNRFKLMLGSILNTDVYTSDHPDQPETATFEKIAEFLQKYDKESEVIILR